MKGSVILWFLGLFMVDLASAQSRIWTIAIGDDWGQHEYRKPDGYIGGFGPDFLVEVCREGGMECRVVWMPYPNCIKTNLDSNLPSAGRAILGRWVDGCSSWVVTVERVHIVSFTDSWLKNRISYLYVRKDSTTPFDADNLRDKRIGFLNGWSTNEICLGRAISPLRKDQMVHRDTTDEILDELEKGNIDAVLNSEIGWTVKQYERVRKINRDIPCSIAGTAMMTRKDSGLPAAFNTGFRKLRDTRKFTKFCAEANAKHDASLNCVE